MKLTKYGVGVIILMVIFGYLTSFFTGNLAKYIEVLESFPEMQGLSADARHLFWTSHADTIVRDYLVVVKEIKPLHHLSLHQCSWLFKANSFIVIAIFFFLDRLFLIVSGARHLTPLLAGIYGICLAALLILKLPSQDSALALSIYNEVIIFIKSPLPSLIVFAFGWFFSKTGTAQATHD